MQRNVFAGYVIWWTALVALYYGQPGLRAETWGLIGLSGVGGIVAGVAINRPSRKLPWLLLTAALTSFTAGQVSFLVAQLSGSSSRSRLSRTCCLLTSVDYNSGFLIFIWSRTPDRDWRGLVDALTVTAGLALLSWISLIVPRAIARSCPGCRKAFDHFFTWQKKHAGHVFLLSRPARAGWSLDPSTWLGGVQLGDLRSGLMQLRGACPERRVVFASAMLSGGWGAAALHSRQSQNCGSRRPEYKAPAQVSRVRLTVLMLASLIAPVVLFIESFRFTGAGT